MDYRYPILRHFVLLLFTIRTMMTGLARQPAMCGLPLTDPKYDLGGDVVSVADHKSRQASFMGKAVVEKLLLNVRTQAN